VRVELTLLSDMWKLAPRYIKPKTREDIKKYIPVKRISIHRKLKLIVPSLSYENSQGDLNNDYWVYKVPFAFRDALDIKLEKKAKKIIYYDDVGNEQTKTTYYMAWTQGCLLNFLEGDLFQPTHDEPCLQIRSAKPMCWNSILGVMDQGYVEYELISKRGIFMTVSQMDFLRILIYGEKSLGIDIWRNSN
jgi:hypothetical protein